MNDNDIYIYSREREREGDHIEGRYYGDGVVPWKHRPCFPLARESGGSG